MLKIGCNAVFGVFRDAHYSTAAYLKPTAAHPILKTADILTSQQVGIRYELASLRDRAIAGILDQALLWFGVFSLAGLLGISGLFGLPSFRSILIVLLLLIIWTYSLVFEILFDGQTPGKKMLGIKVIKLSGIEARGGDYAIRWVFRLLDIWGTLGSLGSMLVSTTPHSQRIGDILADTIVIRLHPKQSIDLPKLLRMHQESTESVVYSRANRFSEEEMLLAMEMLERKREYPNLTNQQLLYELSKKFGKELGIDPPWDADRFIRQVIRDYVLLTR